MKKIFVRRGEQFEPLILNTIGVLELVHQHVLEAVLIVRAQCLVVAQQLMGPQQQLGEIHHAGAAAGFFVRGIDAHPLLLGDVGRLAELRRAPAFFLVTVDEPLRLFRRPVAFVETETLEHAPDQTVLVLGIQNLETLEQPGLLPVRAQQPVRQPVKRADPHAAHRLLEHALDARAHFGGGLVGEGHGKNGVRRYPFDAHEPGDAVREYPGFAGAGAGQYQQRAGTGGHGFALGGVEIGEQGVTSTAES